MTFSIFVKFPPHFESPPPKYLVPPLLCQIASPRIFFLYILMIYTTYK